MFASFSHDDPNDTILTPDSPIKNKTAVPPSPHIEIKAHKKSMVTSIDSIILANNNPNINRMDIYISLYGVRFINKFIFKFGENMQREKYEDGNFW